MDNLIGDYGLINDNPGKFSLEDDSTGLIQSLSQEEI